MHSGRSDVVVGGGGGGGGGNSGCGKIGGSGCGNNFIVWLCTTAVVVTCRPLVTHSSYFSMAHTHLHRPSAAVEAVLILTGSNSGLLV